MLLDSIITWLTNYSMPVTTLSSIAIVLTLGLLIWQLRAESSGRSFDTYEKLMSDFSDVTLRLSDNLKLANQIYSGGNVPAKWSLYGNRAKKAYSYFDGLLGLFERVWIANPNSIRARILALLRLSKREKRLRTWRAWLEDLTTIDLFVDVYYDNDKQFDPALLKEVLSYIRKAKKERTGPSNVTTLANWMPSQVNQNTR